MASVQTNHHQKVPWNYYPSCFDLFYLKYFMKDRHDQGFCQFYLTVLCKAYIAKTRNRSLNNLFAPLKRTIGVPSLSTASVFPSFFLQLPRNDFHCLLPFKILACENSPNSVFRHRTFLNNSFMLIVLLQSWKNFSRHITTLRHSKHSLT